MSMVFSDYLASVEEIEKMLDSATTSRAITSGFLIQGRYSSVEPLRLSKNK
jgi:hypothetical protein